MGLTVITGHRLEALFEALCAGLEAAPAAPMDTETILVPGLGIARWLELRLADRLGITAGVEMPFLGAWLHRLTEPSPLDRDPFSKEVLSWRLWRLLEERGQTEDPALRFGPQPAPLLLLLRRRERRADTQPIPSRYPPPAGGGCQWDPHGIPGDTRVTRVPWIYP